MNLEPISLDQFRIVLTVVEAGSFSAAAKRLRRAQSAVSQSVIALEQQLGVQLFDRSGYRPAITPAGKVLLAEMQAIVARSDRLRAHAKAIAAGLEPELGMVLDAVYSMRRFTVMLSEFREHFPTVAVRLYVEALGGVAEKVLDGTCVLGVLGSMGELPAGLLGHPMRSVTMIPVAAPSHPLAQVRGRVSTADIQEHIQIVLSDRSRLTAGRDFLVISPQTWRVADLASKHEIIRAGLGWGTMPHHLIESELADGSLRRLSVEGMPESDLLPAFAFHRSDEVLGPAGQWMLARLLDGSREAPDSGNGARQNSISKIDGV